MEQLANRHLWLPRIPEGRALVGMVVSMVVEAVVKVSVTATAPFGLSGVLVVPSRLRRRKPKKEVTST